MNATTLLQKVGATGHYVPHGTANGVLICDALRERSNPGPPLPLLEASGWISLARDLLTSTVCEVRRDAVLRSSLGPRPTTPVSMLTRSEASRLLVRHPPSVEHLGRLPAAPLFLPPQPAHGPPHGGDGDPLPLLALPQLAVAL